jgi:hypothetical protein
LRTSKIVLIAVLLAGSLPLLYPSLQPAGADTLTVTRKNDPAPNGCRRNDCSLREAVIASNNRPGPDVIKLGRGRYELTRPTPDEDEAQTGDLDIAKNVTIAGAGPNKTIIDGNGNDRIFHTYSTVDNVRFSDLAIKRGSVIVDEPQEQGGGGILNLGKLTLANVLVANNKVRVDGNGGGIANFGRLVISNSRITDNSARGSGDGGGIGNGGGRLRLRNSRVDHNRAAGSFGAGLYNFGSIALIARSSVDHNRLVTACCGGGVYADEGSELEMIDSALTSNFVSGCCGSGLMLEDSTALVRGSLIKGNLVEGCCGGGVMAQGDSNVVLRNTSLVRNKAKGCCAGGLAIQGLADAKLVNSRVAANKVPSGCCAGGLLNQSDGRLTLIDSIVRSNESPSAGSAGILIQSTTGLALVLKGTTVAGNSTPGAGGGIGISSGSARLTNSTISGNTSGGTGGGISENTTGEISLTHVTITKNESAGAGGGIVTDGGTWPVLRSIVANNDGANDCNAILVGPTGKNLDEDGDCFDNPAAIHRNPRLNPLADNGAKTPTHLPKRRSRAVDAAPGSTCPPPNRDQRGVRRPQNGDGEPGRKCDLGAVERKP